MSTPPPFQHTNELKWRGKRRKVWSSRSRQCKPIFSQPSLRRVVLQHIIPCFYVICSRLKGSVLFDVPDLRITWNLLRPETVLLRSWYSLLPNSFRLVFPEAVWAAQGIWLRERRCDFKGVKYSIHQTRLNMPVSPPNARLGLLCSLFFSVIWLRFKGMFLLSIERSLSVEHPQRLIVKIP